MGRKLKVSLVVAVALALCGCRNPLMDKVIATVAQKDMAPRINLKTAAGSIASGGSFDFGTISIDTSKNVTFTIENLGTASLSLTDTPKVSISGINAAFFVVTSDPTTPIPDGSSTTFVLEFHPTTSGSKSATLTIPNNDATNSTYTVSLSGTASVQPAIRVEQSGTDIPHGTGSYSYPQTGLTYSTTDVTFTIRNVGTATLNLTGTPDVQSSSGEFIVVSQPSSSSIAAGGGTTTFTMHFTPSAEGIRTATITIPNDDPDRSPFTFTARGIASTVMLPRTGQTTSFATGDDGELEKGVAWPTTRFLVSGSEVSDTLTGLAWPANANLLATTYSDQDTIDLPAGDGKVSWQHALDFVSYLNGISFLGHADWRLPNRDEMRSLANYEKADVGAWLNEAAQHFANAQSNYYWTSTTDAGTTANAWLADMSTGRMVNTFPKTNFYFVWPVRSSASAGSIRLPATGQTVNYYGNDDGALERGAAWPASRFVDNGDTTITDNLTGLVWRNVASGTLSWSDALALASNPWRLPNLNELDSLLNASYADSSQYLQVLGLTTMANARYWTSTVSAEITGDAWFVQMGSGAIGPMARTSTTNRAILVRDPQ